MILLTSIPKSGTHLLLPILEEMLHLRAVKAPKGDVRMLREDLAEMGDPPLSFNHLRLGDSAAVSADIRPIVLIRDPRDIIVSMRDFLMTPRPASDGRERAGKVLRAMEADERIRALTIGFEVKDFIVRPLHEHCSGFLRWARFGGAIVRYEDLLGPKAGEIVAGALGRPDEAAAAQAIVGRHVGRPSRTLHVGKAGRWRTEISPALQAYIRQRAHGVVEHLGYGWD